MNLGLGKDRGPVEFSAADSAPPADGLTDSRYIEILPGDAYDPNPEIHPPPAAPDEPPISIREVLRAVHDFVRRKGS